MTFSLTGYMHIFFLLHVARSFSANCEFRNATVLCKNGEIPEHIPSNVSQVFLQDVDLDTFRIDNNNSQVYWIGVTRLDIEASKGKKLRADSLSGLKNLQYLGIHGASLELITHESFRDLENLIVLNISQNGYLHIEKFAQTFVSKKNLVVLPNVQELYMAGVDFIRHHPVPFDLLFKNLCTKRNLTIVDISKNYVTELISVLQPLCNAGLKTLIARDLNVAIGCERECVKNTNVCQSLEKVDLSGLHVPNLNSERIADMLWQRGRCQDVKMFYNIQTLYLDNFYENDLEIGKMQGKDLLTFHMNECPFRLRKLSFVGNNVKFLNVSITVNNQTVKTMRTIDISNNKLEYVTPSNVRQLKNLQYLNMANNSLYIMLSHHPEEFVSMFSTLHSIEEISLSGNHLHNLPNDIFQFNIELVHLDLSNNRFTDITFRITHLSKLRNLILKRNNFKIIGEKTQEGIDYLNARVDLGENPFVCACAEENIITIRWLKSTRVITQSDDYQCTLNGNAEPLFLFSMAEQETERYCLMLLRNKILYICVPTVLLLLVMGLMMGSYFIKYWKRKQTIQTVVKQFRTGKYPKRYLLFFSFCSEDTDIAIQNIYPNLKQELQNIIQNNQRELLCIGDQYFRPGFPILDEAEQGIKESAVLLAVVSNEYCAKAWCEQELILAIHARVPIILLFIEKVNRNTMPLVVKNLFRNNVHASWVDDENGGHPVPVWNNFCGAIFALAANPRVNVIQENENILKEKM
nr:sP-TLR7 [Cyclina sinensis]